MAARDGPDSADAPGLTGGVRAAMRAFDWGKTPLGPQTAWPQSLKSFVCLMLESSQPMFMAWGRDRTWLYNDAFTPILGRKHPGALGAPSHLVWAEAWPVLEPLFDQVFGGQGVRMDDFSLELDRNGGLEEAHFAFSYNPVRDETDQVAGLFGVCTETTNQVLAMRRLDEERRQSARLFEQAPGFIIIMTGPEHVVEFVNHTHRRVFGSEDWIGKTMRDAFPSIAGQGFYEALDEVYATGVSRQFENSEVRYRRSPDGPEEVRCLNFIYAPTFDEAGAVTGIFCDGFDVTETYRTQQALRDSEASLRQLNADLERRVIERTQARGLTWQVSPDLMGALNSQGYFETSNPAWQSMLGWSEAEVAGMSIFELLHPDDLERTRAGFALTQIGQPAIRFPNRYRCKDGGYRWISWVGVPEDGMVYCTGRDITDEKAAEAELADAQEALRQSQKMEAVGQLTGGIAHDFNNLLAGISGSLEILETRIGQGRFSDLDRYIDAAQGSARRASALTQRLLAFSRRQTLDPKPTDINKLIAGVDEMIRRTVGPSISMEVVGAGGLWLTKVDPSQLENALLNLSINARDAMPDGGRLTIETANRWLDARAAKDRDVPIGQYVSVSVTDSGTGMTPEVMERAFDPFYTTKPLGQGTGLGLSMIHGFVRQSGGQIRIYSELGAGTTMTLYLPRFIGELDSMDLPETAPATDTGHGETVLVIDDEPIVRMLIVEVLEEAGYAVLEADDGPSGLAILQSDARIDFLITDVGLPGGMNGRQVADAARATRPTLKVLFVTGYAENAVVGNGHLDAGMQVITKPFTMAALGNKVRDMIES